MRNKTFIWFIVILLFATSSYSVYKNYFLKKDSYFKKELEIVKSNASNLIHQNIPIAFGFTTKEAGNLIAKLKNSDYSIIVLFEPNQCGSCLNEKILWNSISDKKIVPIYGVTYLNDTTELNQFLKQSDIHIPVYQDTSAVIGKWLLPNGVPVKLMVDKNLNIIWADYVRDSPEKRQDFESLLKYFINSK